MADLLPPWTIDSLDQLKSSIDDLTLTLDSSLYLTSVTLWDAYASVSASATVTADATRVQYGGAAVNGTATVTADAVRVQYASASITASASVTCAGTRVQNASVGIDAVAIVLDASSGE